MFQPSTVILQDYYNTKYKKAKVFYIYKLNNEKENKRMDKKISVK